MGPSTYLGMIVYGDLEHNSTIVASTTTPAHNHPNHTFHGQCGCRYRGQPTGIRRQREQLGGDSSGKAHERRQKIRDMETTLDGRRLLRNNNNNNNDVAVVVLQVVESHISLQNEKSRLGSRCRWTGGRKVWYAIMSDESVRKVFVCCHYIGEDSVTSRRSVQLSVDEDTTTRLSTVTDRRAKKGR